MHHFGVELDRVRILTLKRKAATGMLSVVASITALAGRVTMLSPWLIHTVLPVGIPVKRRDSPADGLR